VRLIKYQARGKFNIMFSVTVDDDLNGRILAACAAHDWNKCDLIRYLCDKYLPETKKNKEYQL